MDRPIAWSRSRCRERRLNKPGVTVTILLYWCMMFLAAQSMIHKLSRLRHDFHCWRRSYELTVKIYCTVKCRLMLRIWSANLWISKQWTETQQSRTFFVTALLCPLDVRHQDRIATGPHCSASVHPGHRQTLFLVFAPTSCHVTINGGKRCLYICCRFH